MLDNLPYSVRVAQENLDLSVGVQIPVRQVLKIKSREAKGGIL